MTTHDRSTEYRFSGYRLDARHKRLFDREGRLVTLSARPFDVLLTLVQRSGELVSREELMEVVWPRLVVEEHNLTQAISIVRKALDDTTSESQFIRTVPGRGYSFVATVEEVTASEPADVVGQATHSFTARVTQWLRPASLLLLIVWMAVMLGPDAPSSASPALSGNTPEPLGVSSIPQPQSRIRNSIAVLPLTVLGKQSDELFATGLHDELISQLTQVDSLSVIARSSVVALLDEGASTLDLARILRVESLLSGTIRLAGNDARISLQLVDVRTGVTLWSGTYDVDQQNLDEMISIQADIALNVAAALKVEIPQRGSEDYSEVPPELTDAYRYNLAAQNAHHRQAYDDEWRLALKAIELNPDFYEGLHTFASVNVVLVARPLPGMTSEQHAELALTHAKRLIELAPERPEGHALHAVTLAMNRQWAEAADAVELLAQTQASWSDLEYAARIAMTLGDFETAIAIYEANLAAELLNPYGRGFLMVALELAGQRDQARRKYQVGQDLHGAWWGESVNVLLALGRDESVGDVEQLAGVSSGLKTLLTQLDDIAAIKQALHAYRDAPVKRPVDARYYAALAAEIGEHELAVELLRTSLQDAWSGFFWTWLPVFDATRQHESFRALVQESGLAEYWHRNGWPVMCQPLANDFSCDWRAYPASPAAAVPQTSIALADN